MTTERLGGVIARALDLDPGTATARAEAVLDLFGLHDEIIDNLLEPEDRQFFYALENAGVLTTRSEENELVTGHTWRTHYWVMRDAARGATAAADATAPGAARDADSVYDALPDACWSRP